MPFCLYGEKVFLFFLIFFVTPKNMRKTHESKQKEKQKMNKTTEAKKGNRNGKKIGIAAAILVAAVILMAVIAVKFAPKASEGAKEISVLVTDDQKQTVNYEVHTDAAYLRQALEEIEELRIEGTESDYGFVVQSINGVQADFEKDGAYWAFYVDGEYCNYGVDEQPVEDGQSYEIVYTPAE